MFQYRCPQCGTVQVSTQPLQEVHCQQCGCRFNPNYNNAYNNCQQQNAYGNGIKRDNVFDAGPSGKSRGVAAILAILLGCLGIQYFYLGKNTAGVVCLLITLLSCFILGCLLSFATLVQGILMLTMSEEEFERRYIQNPASMVF